MRLEPAVKWLFFAWWFTLVAMVCLKCAGVVEWEWWIVGVPVLLPLAGSAAIAFVTAVMMALAVFAIVTVDIARSVRGWLSREK